MSEKSDSTEKIDAALRTLGEHFECVQIFAAVTKDGVDGGGTSFISRGTGNWFARYGQIKMWCIRNEGVEIQRDIQAEE